MRAFTSFGLLSKSKGHFSPATLSNTAALSPFTGLNALRANATTSSPNIRVTPDANPNPAKQDMFCFQCEQTRDNVGCTKVTGVCGKTAETAALQDLLVHHLKALSWYMSNARQVAGNDSVDAQTNDINIFTLKAMFSTLTNVNFDSVRFQDYLSDATVYREKAKAVYEASCKKAGVTPKVLAGDFGDLRGKSIDELVKLGEATNILLRREAFGADISGMQELVTYGLKGLSAYAEHAEVLGQEDPAVYRSLHDIMAALLDTAPTLESLIGAAMKVGETNYRVMQLLDTGSTTKYGNPTPTKVRVSAVKGKCILVSGHDLRDVEEVLKQTEGKGINVYTHGELLPAHGYPGLNKYKHLVGNYGGAWQLQKFDFSLFPGPIVMTTNCLIEPKKSYKDRLYTRSVVGWPGVKHITDYDFSAVVQQAQALPGFEKDEPEKLITTGWGRHSVLGAAPVVLDHIKNGKIKHFFLIGGCDGAEGDRSYFRDLALAAPKDSVILTLGCGKYRFNKYEFGDIEGVPRLLDIGQCNDAYGAIQIASALASALNTNVNSLPLSFAVSWFEQKAVAVLLTLLHLGIKNIHLGPALPAFCTPNILKFLVDTFQIAPINKIVKVDLEQMLGKQ